MFAIVSLPILGAVGLGVDYSRTLNVKGFVQDHADGAALGAVQLGPTGDYSSQIEFMRSAIGQRYGTGTWVDKLEITGRWLSTTDFRVTARGSVPVTILRGVPGFPHEVPISASATARIAEPKLIYTPPEVMELDPEADDYNRISVYCYDPENRRDRETHGRTKMTVIADNAGTKYDYTMPTCEAEQVLSYKLMNVRGARSNSELWDKKSAERYNYYTDTELKDGAEVYDLDNADILETVLCDKLSDCQPASEGGILPEGKERTPQHAKNACSPGKYMYYGWEDRPPGSEWTDRDYDDIRIIIGCPTVEEVGERVVRLID